MSRINRYIFSITFMLLAFPSSCGLFHFENNLLAYSPPAKPVRKPVIPLPTALDTQDTTVIRKAVQPGDSISKILKSYGTPYSRIHEVIGKSQGIFDVRRIRPGKLYYIVKDAKKKKDFPVRFFVYERSLQESVVFDMEEPVKVYISRKPIETRTRTAEGRIESSLWQAFDDQGLPEALVSRITGIFAWEIDFRLLNTGDEFGIIYEEEHINGNPVGIGAVKAVRLTCTGKDYYAFAFRKNDKESIAYYNDKGQNLQKAYLKAPLKYTRVSSGFSRSRLHPILNVYRPHLAIDYAAPEGTPVMSVGSGRVARIAYSRSAGKYIEIHHGSKYRSRYIHLSGYADGIKVGMKVEGGDCIGYVGSTGLATGPHLDFRFWEEGRAVDYSDMELPNGDPIGWRSLPRFNRYITGLKRQLDEGGPSFAAQVSLSSEGKDRAEIIN